MLQSHVRDIVDVDFHLQHHDQGLSIELDGEDRGGEEEFAYHGLSLGGRSISFTFRTPIEPREPLTAGVLVRGFTSSGRGEVFQEPRIDVEYRCSPSY